MKITIDNRELEARAGETILETARRYGIHIPTLCYNEAFAGQGRCRMCMVEVDTGGVKRTVASCTYPVSEGIRVLTSTPSIEKHRKTISMLLFKRAPESPTIQQLYRSYECEDNNLAEEAGEKCILCNLCVKACETIGASAISLIMRGIDKQVSTPYDEPADVCLGCGACAAVCPTGAIDILENDGKRIMWHKEFELVKCERCGTTYATREQIEYWQKKAIQASVGVYEGNLCESCRKKATAEKIQEFRHLNLQP